MKNIHKLIIAGFLFLLTLGFSSAGYVDFGDNVGTISQNSIDANQNGNTVESISTIGIELLKKVKLVVQGVILIYMVYIGAQMVISMGTDEEGLSQAKRQLWYSLVGLIFINIPGTLYQSFRPENHGTINGRESYSSWIKDPVNSDGNVFINWNTFGNTLNENIIGFFEVAAFGFAVLMITYSGIKLVLSRGQDDEVSEAKNKIIWSIVGLITIGFIEVWKNFVYDGKISDGTSIFETATNLILFFAAPVAIVFLTLAAYYYITANGDEDRVSKAKKIVVNTLIATVILLASYSVLLDLTTL